MITIPGYTVMGEDGKEYGPNTADQIRAWVAEGRLESKTPVRHSDTRDWVFLGALPEFAELFLPKPPPPPPPPSQLGKWLLVATIGALAIIVFLVQEKFKHH